MTQSFYFWLQLLFTDFDPDSLGRVLELINTGATNLDGENKNVYTGMLEIIECLKINIKLEEIWLNTLCPESSSTTADNDSALFCKENLKSEKVSYR